jgi:phosphate/phosphite/phosphonate ABC transporter binding protein
MKRLLPVLLLGLVGCTLPLGVGLIPAAQPTSQPTLALGRPTSMPTARGQLGTAQNPLILALPPSAQPQPEILQAGKVLASLLEKNTPYKFVAVISPSETELIQALGNGNAHIAVLSPFGYLLASEQGYAQAAFAREQDGAIFYGAELISRSDAGYTVYYDPIQGKNLAEAPVALAQFKDKKPCWADARSPSGYVVPLGFLGEAGVSTREPAFLASHPSVVRALYAGGICDFGATYVDARSYPGLEDELPNVMKKILVVWAIPPVIPYETLVYAHGMTEDVRRALSRAFVDLMSGADGQSAMQTLYGFRSMQVVQDGQYADFRQAVKASGLELSGLIK